MAREVLWFSNDETESIEANSSLQLFTVAQDLKVEQKPIRQRYRLLIQDYSRYVQSKKTTLKPRDVKLLDQMLVLRLNNLINQVEQEIYDGKMLSTVLGVTEQELRKPMDNFGKEYRKLLKARENLGYIPKFNQSRVDDNYKALIAGVRKKIFAPVINLFSFDPSDLPEEVTITEEDKKMLLNENVTPLETLYNQIVGYLKSQNINAKVELVDNQFIRILDDESNIK
jgi:hypothetical protein